MADNRKLTGKADSSKVSTSEKYELDTVMKKTGATKAEVLAAVKKVGDLRKDVEAELGKKK